MGTESKLINIRSGPFAFASLVPLGGFAWVDLEPSPLFDLDGEQPEVLAGPFLLTHGDSWRREATLADRRLKGLHRELANLAELDDHALPGAVLAFANRHGRLGVARVPLEPPAGVRELCFAGESLASWRYEARMLAALVHWWDASRDDDDSQAQRYVSLIDRADELPRVQVYWIPSTEPRRLPAETLASEREHPELFQLWRARKRFPAAEALRVAVHTFVNRKLEGHVSVQVQPYWKGWYLWPDSLLAALYVLFSRELLGDRWRDDERRLCARPGCGRFFAPTHGRQRYCRPACSKLRWFHENRGKGDPVGHHGEQE